MLTHPCLDSLRLGSECCTPSVLDSCFYLKLVSDFSINGLIELLR